MDTKNVEAAWKRYMRADNDLAVIQNVHKEYAEHGHIPHTWGDLGDVIAGIKKSSAETKAARTAYRKACRKAGLNWADPKMELMFA